MTDPINYDSKWERIVEAAQTPYSGSATMSRCLLDDAEISHLTDMPVCVVTADQNTPPPNDPARSAFFRQQAEKKGWAYTNDVDWPSVSERLGSSVWWRYRSMAAPDAPALRHGASYGTEYNLRAPLAHRLTGDKVPVLGVIVLGGLEINHLDQSDAIISQLHEMFHLVQLHNSAPKDRLLDQVQRERDADQAAVTAFQTCCNGSQVDAARYILRRTLETVMSATAKYFFFPELSPDNLIAGPLIVKPLYLQGLYEQAGQTCPPSDLMKQWALLSAGVMPAHIYGQYKAELDNISAFVSETEAEHTHPLGSVTAIQGIARMLERQVSNLTCQQEDLAKKVVQSARLLRPDLLV